MCLIELKAKNAFVQLASVRKCYRIGAWHRSGKNEFLFLHHINCNVSQSINYFGVVVFIETDGRHSYN